MRIGNRYYLVNGEEVILDGIIEGETRKYIVTPYYYGTAMSVNCYSGEHTEVEMDYEHEGFQITVNEIFEKPPVQKIEAKYKAIADKVLLATEGLALIEKDKNRLSLELRRYKHEIEKMSETAELAKKHHEDLEQIREEINRKKGELNSIKDGISNLSQEKRDKELAYLKKRDFKLTCLENGGVDNWEWYGESLEDYFKEYDE